MISLKELKEIASDFSVLYVEDDKDIANTLINYLSKFFKEVVYAKDGEEGLNIYKEDKFDIVITDIIMPKMTGLEMSEKIKELNTNQNIIIISAYSEIDNFLTSIKLGIDGYIIKPVDYDSINSILFKTVLKIKAFKDNENYKIKMKNLLNNLNQTNKELEQYLNIIEKVAIVSKTDLKGQITQVNDLFVQVSGYSKDELLGKNHNIVRHNDMASSVYKDMWTTIKSGNIWEGSIKNRKKNGDAYFVHATIVPILDKTNNSIKEYVGIRFLTTKEEEEKRDFQKKVMVNNIEFKKTNLNAIEKISQLEKELEEIKIEDSNLRHKTKNIDKKYKKSLSQIKFYEKELIKKEEQYKKILEVQKHNLDSISKSHKNALATIEKQRIDLTNTKEESHLKSNEILHLNSKLNDQNLMIHDLRDTIRNIKKS